MPQIMDRAGRYSCFVNGSRVVFGLIFLAIVTAPLMAYQTDGSLPDVQQRAATDISNATQTPASSGAGKDQSKPALDPNAPVQSNKDKLATGVNAITGMGAVDPVNYQPMDRRQRWQYYVNQNFISVGSYFGPVSSSIIDQIGGQPPEWGGGMKGYSRRLASRLGTGIIQGTVQSAGAAFLGQDPRYIRSADPRILHRIGHAFLFSVITYNNEGKRRLALATLGSYYASSMLTDCWYPGRYTVLGDGVRDGNRQAIMAGVINQIQEFWPEIRRYVFRRK